MGDHRRARQAGRRLRAGMSVIRRRALLLAASAAILFPAAPAPAHPLGNFTINHYSAIQVTPEAIEVRYVVDMAEIPTFQELQEQGIAPDPAHPGVARYVARRAEGLGAGLALEVDGQRVPLSVTGTQIVFPPGAGDLPTLKLGIDYRASLPAASRTPRELRYRVDNYRERAGWKEIIAVAGDGVALLEASVPDRDRSRQLSDYPEDLLDSPPQVVEARLIFAPSAGTGAPAMAAQGPPGVRGEVQGRPRSAVADLVAAEHLALPTLLLALGVAAGLGALHALEPGHGKTVVAAYLVGSRGTAAHALWLGLIVTASHTAGVYLLGAITLYASRYIVPERLYPWLGVLSGVLVAGLGVWLFVQRYAGRAHEHGHPHAHHDAGHDHAHEHDHGPGHDHDPDGAHDHGHPHDAALDTRDHDHEHDARPGHGGHRHHHGAGHVHPGRSPGAVTAGQLLALGVSGGIVPCPGALVVLLSAVALNRIGFGLLLIVAFSVGLALVLMAIGVLMVHAGRWMARWRGDGPLVTRWLPLTSSVVITLLGVGLILQALVAAGAIRLAL